MGNPTKLVNKTNMIVQPSSEYDETHSLGEADLIGKLPDDVLVSILSMLDLKETIRTRVLSRRWRHLWTFTGRLNFENNLGLDQSEYFSLVKNVLESHQSTNIDEFTIIFRGDGKIYKHEIDGWINFALQKRVRKLQLKLTCTGEDPPLELSLEEYDLCGSYILTTQLLCNRSLDSLAVLQLTDVTATDEVLEYFLSHCPFLEVLSLADLKSLKHLKFRGPSLKLKHVKIINCWWLEYIEFFEINLLSFKYSGPRVIRIFVNNVPHLLEASVGGHYARFFVENMCHCPSPLSQLKKLRVKLDYKIFKNFPKFPELSNLRELILKLDAHSFDYILLSTSLLNVSPLLHRLKIKIWRLYPCQRRLVQYKVNERKAKPHHFLKVIELFEFLGYPNDAELLHCLLKRAVSIERLVIHTSYKRKLEKWKLEQEPEASLLQLKTRLPTGTELVIL